MIVVKRTFQQILGGAPFIISGACGLFRTKVLREVGLSDRTKVEDLDLTWTLVARGYKVRQANRCIVYPQECSSLREDWRRWRRWIMGYAVCMRLHRSLLLTRFGLFSILPMFLVVVLGIGIYTLAWTRLAMGGEAHTLPFQLFPLLWVAVISVVGTISAIHHRAPWLVVLAPLAVLYVLLSYAVWLVHGLKALFTGRELGRDKPTGGPCGGLSSPRRSPVRDLRASVRLPPRRPFGGRVGRRRARSPASAPSHRRPHPHLPRSQHPWTGRDRRRLPDRQPRAGPRPNQIGDGSRIGFAAEIKNAIIEERVTIGPQCFVADSKGTRRYLGRRSARPITASTARRSKS